MVTLEKPKGITVTIRDRQNNKSASITVYGEDLDTVKTIIENTFRKRDSSR